MEFSTEWKSRWPVSSTSGPPSLLSEKNSNTALGPLCFDVNPNSPISQLLNSPSLSPRLPPPYPHLSLAGLLRNYDSVPSSATSISSLLGPLLPDYSHGFHSFNSLQLLQIPRRNLVIAFFPAGENSDRVGFTIISVKDGILSVNPQKGKFFQLAEEGYENRIRITHLMVNPVDEDDVDGGFDESNVNRSENLVGFLMVCAKFSVYWYRVGFSSANECSEVSVRLGYVGCCSGKMLSGNAVVSVSWSPHLREECIALLENGDLLLFDVNFSSHKKSRLMSLIGSNNKIISKKLHVSLHSKVKLGKEENGGERGWFDCKFSWHPRIFIASHRCGIFLVDLRYAGKCNVCCLLKIGALALVKNDGFVALTNAGSDGFYFAVTTRCLLLLFDIRKPMMPVLQWVHGLLNPRYMAVIRLSEMRVNPEDNNYRLASESGHCILLGSFWDSSFSLFCYGPNINGNISVYSDVEKFCNSYYAWGLPSELSLSGCDCNCGSCLVRDEFSKKSFPVWIDWRHKKQLVMGFSILEADLSAQLSSPKNFGGFTLVRLMSSGKLEAQEYHAAWESDSSPEMIHRRADFDSVNNLLYAQDNTDYNEKQKFQYLKLEFLNAYLQNDLAQLVFGKREKTKESSQDLHEKSAVRSNLNVQHQICAIRQAFEIPRAGSSLTVFDMLKDINLPTGIREVALRSTWATLPANVLRLAFSTYSNFHKNGYKHPESLEFLDISDQFHVPPFPLGNQSCRSNKSSTKVQGSDALVCPLVPLQFLTTLHYLYMEESKMEIDLDEVTEEFSADSLIKTHCDKVMEAVDDNVLESDFVSLADDTDYFGTNSLKFFYHKPSVFSENLSGVRPRPGCEDDIFSTCIFRRSQKITTNLDLEMAGQELFDVGCPLKLKYEDRSIQIDEKELELFQNLKKQDLDFQKSFKPYQDWISNSDMDNQLIIEPTLQTTKCQEWQ